MLFKEALELLHEGKPMHRCAWPIDEGYLSLMPGMKHVWKVILVPNPNAGNFIFSLEDFEADDWKEYDVPKAEAIPVVIDAL